jgi:hypothetical protein|tara:strand:- start:78 stop:575 length:498 start_codon:yes stop_codon:yes gene_type:complete
MTAARIQSANGQFSFPGRVAFYVDANDGANQDLGSASNTTYVKVEWERILYEQGGSNFSLTDNEYTIPEGCTGLWQWNLNLNFTVPNASIQFLEASIINSGGTPESIAGLTHASNESGGNDYSGVHVAGVMKCTAGDTIYINVRQGQASSSKVFISSNWSGFFVG